MKSIDKTAKSIGAFDSINYGVYSAPQKLPEFDEIRQNNGDYAIQGHRFWYQSKARMRFHISD